MQYVETPIEDTNEIIQSITCPDGKKQCPDGTTCCKFYDGGYDCCPVPDAVCCKNGMSCCPYAMTCCGFVGCCPEPNAVCCKGNTHCCPHGTRCDGDYCIGSHFLPMGLPEGNIIEKVQLCA